MSIAGHYWTVWPLLRDRDRLTAPPSEPWSTEVLDPVTGPVPLSGRLTRHDPATLVLMVHGLGGCVDSLYLLRAARVAERLGVSYLRLNLRGADRRSHDFYHAGLTGDLEAALASPALAAFERVVVLGYSVGGHLVLRLATEVRDARVRAVAAVSAPLDLRATVDHFDQPWRRPYREYVLEGLRDIYRAVAERRGDLPAPVEEVTAARTIRRWDELTVVPRFGFDSADHYYATASVAPRLGRLRVPALLVVAEGDPMVTAASVRAGLDAAPRGHELRALFPRRGGHVGFPAGLDLGLDGERGLETQVLGWLLGH